MSEQRDFGCGGGGCILIMLILFLIGCFFANRQGMDVSEIFRNFMDNIGR
jgi:hypothetical protein